MTRIPVTRWPWAVRLGYVAVLCFATLVPFGVDPDLGAALGRVGRALSPSLDASDYVDAVRNTVLFAGWGGLWFLTSRSRRELHSVWWAAVSGAAISFGLEGLQLFSHLRHANVLDLLTNTGGAALGSAGTVLLTRTLRARRRSSSYLGLPTLLILVGYGLAVLVETAFPVLRSELLPVWGGPVNRLLGALQVFELRSIAELPWSEGLLFVPAASMGVAALVEEMETDYVRSAIHTVGFGALALAMAEVLHGAASYPIQLGPLAVHVAGVAIGAAGAVLLLPPATREIRGRYRPLAFGLFYVGLLLCWVWRPFDFAPLQAGAMGEHLELGRFIPLSAHGIRGDLYSVADVVQLFALHLPLGGLLAVWPVRRSGPLRGLLPALYVAALGEIGQIVVVSRFFDVTDLLVAVAGAAVGYAVVRRAGFHVRGQLLPSGAD